MKVTGSTWCTVPFLISPLSIGLGNKVGNEAEANYA